MATANLTHRHIFGLKADVADNLQHIDETLLVYPAGHNVVVYNADDKRQKFIHGTDGTEGITALAVCPSKRFVAVAERSERALVNVYDLKTLKKRKVLNTPECGSDAYVSMCFSQDNQLLLTQGGAPDWTLVIWNWAKARPLATVKVSPVGGAPVRQCSLSPVESAVVCVSGDEVFRFYRLVDNSTFRPMPQPRVEMQEFTAHAWLKQPEDHVVLGTAAGELLLFANGEYLAALSCSPGQPGSVTCIATCTKGFVTGGANGAVHIFEPAEDAAGQPAKLFSCTKTVSIENCAGVGVHSLSISPSEDVLACTMANHQLYSMPLMNTEMLKAEDIDFVSTAFHGPGMSGVAHVTGLDICVRKPLVVTCGIDRWVRVWNYQDKTSELAKQFSEECHSVAFHPSGLHILVGFSDKLRLMNILMDNIRQFREFSIKQCRECRFSNGGQYFAAVNGNTITVFNTYTCEKLLDMRGHNGKVRSLHWTNDDSGIISAGMDGAVYQWDLEENKREGEFVQKGCHYSCALCNADGTAVFAVGNDRMLKEIEFPVAQVSKELDCGSVLSQIVLSHSQRMLFAGTSDADRPGTIRSYKFPLTGDYTEYQCFSSPVTRMRISHDDMYLFAADEHGCVVMFEVRDKEGRPPARSREVVDFAEEILVTKSDLEEKQTLMQDLKNKVDELTLHNEYQLRLKDMNYNEKIKEVTEKFTQELEQDKNKFELLREEKNDMEMEYEERIKQMEEKHQHELQEIEASYQQKIMAEVERYQQLVRERDQQQQHWEQQQKLLVSTHERYVSEITEEFEQRLEEDRSTRKQMEADRTELSREFEETKRQLEGDIDQEIEELKEKYDARLNAEREDTLRYKGENGIMKKKFSALQKDIEDQREEIKALLEKEQQLYARIKGLETEIHAHKREIRSRDETIGEKEKKIYELKKKNQELEKFKFVLDFKIKELKRQIEPRENEINDMKEQIKEMDQELEQFHKSNAQLDLMIGELRARLDAMQRDIMAQRASLGDQDTLVRRFRNELHECVQFIQDPKQLREAVTRLYKKHVHTQVRTGEFDLDIQREYHRQREYLEKSVESLKRKYVRDVAMHRADNLRIMQDNMTLIKEINELRVDAQILRQQQHEQAAQLSQRRLRPAGATGTAGAMGGADPRAIIDQQRQQIDEMRALVTSLEDHLVATRPRSREVLPPMDGHAESLEDRVMSSQSQRSRVGTSHSRGGRGGTAGSKASAGVVGVGALEAEPPSVDGSVGGGSVEGGSVEGGEPEAAEP